MENRIVECSQMINFRSKIGFVTLFVVIFLSLSLIAAPLLVQAQSGGGSGFSTDNPIKGSGGVADKVFGCKPDQGAFCIIVRVLIFLASIAFITAALFLVFGGFRYIAAQGNDEALETAKKTIYRSVIGLVIIILSWVILSVVVRLAQFGDRGFGFFRF